MRQLVDHQYRGVARERGVEIEFAARDAPIFHLEHGQLLEPADQAFRFETAVGLDVSNDQVDAGGARRARRLEHGVGLADARDGAEEDFQAPPAFGCFVVFESGQQLIRIEPLLVGH